MLKRKIELEKKIHCLITVQDNTMLKPTVGGGDDKKSLITVQDNTMLKPSMQLFGFFHRLITVQDNTMLKHS